MSNIDVLPRREGGAGLAFATLADILSLMLVVLYLYLSEHPLLARVYSDEAVTAFPELYFAVSIITLLPSLRVLLFIPLVKLSRSHPIRGGLLTMWQVLPVLFLLSGWSAVGLFMVSLPTFTAWSVLLTVALLALMFGACKACFSECAAYRQCDLDEASLSR